VSLRPDVDWTSQFRWWQMLEQIAGDTHTTTELVLAMWQQIPGGWDLLKYRTYPVADGFRQSGMGVSAVRTDHGSFTGAQLATDFVVQAGRAYLFGVVARTNIWSTLSTTSGGQIPEPADLSNFRIWGSLTCRVPLIQLRTRTIYIP
jgi:hypothetical protein